MKRKVKMAVGLILVLCMLLSTMGTAMALTTNKTGKGDLTSLGRYAKTINITIGHPSVTSPGLPKGETFDNNYYKNMLEKDLNVKIKYTMTVDPSTYDQKVGVSIASGQMPDILFIQDQRQLNQLIEAGMVADLTPYIKLLTPNVKKVYDSYGAAAFTTVKSNGKYMALPNTNMGYQHNFLWVRKDWMKLIGAKEPKNMADITQLAKDFIDKDPGKNGPGNTIGMVLHPTVAGNYNTEYDFSPVFGSFSSFPRLWLVGKDGKVSYGTTAPQTKTALAAVAKMYKDGLIDKQFVVRKDNDISALLTSGKSGIAFGAWWAPYSPLADTLKIDPNMDWYSYQAPLDSKGNFNTYSPQINTQWIVVNKKFKHPEAIVKILNYEADAKTGINAVSANHYQPKKIYIDWHIMPLPLQINDGSLNTDIAAVSKRYYNNPKYTFADAAKDPLLLSKYGKAAADSWSTSLLPTIEKGSKLPHTDAGAWQAFAAYTHGMYNQTAPYKQANNIYPGVTKTMAVKWTNLKKLEDEALLSIITGAKPLSYFDEFVKKWNDQGGTQITKEVQDIANRIK